MHTYTVFCFQSVSLLEAACGQKIVWLVYVGDGRKFERLPVDSLERERL